LKHAQPYADKSITRLSEIGIKLNGSGKIAHKTQENIFNLIKETKFVRNSKNLDYFLQLSMMYIAFQLKQLSKSNFKKIKFGITTSVFRQPGTLHVKPCYYGPGECAVDHPTISLTDKEHRPFPSIGLSGISLLSNSILICKNLKKSKCQHHINLSKGFSSVSALCIPLDLRTVFKDIKIEFLEAHPHCVCTRGKNWDSCQDPILDSNIDNLMKDKQKSYYGVITLESDQPVFDLDFCYQLFRNEQASNIREVLTLLKSIVRDYVNRREVDRFG